ncbi:MAG: alpha/beta hydrolase [Acetobacter sp.]|uniref:RBBP9/YdeN family alpha/beta hydrolase n=1 Tax=Acetobacter sp. TaxID=440 RepID=UPI0039ED198C
MRVPDDVLSHISSSLADFEIVVVPGLDGSAPHHWQSSWQRALRSRGVSVRRVRQENWSRPHYKNWMATLVATIGRSKKPVLLVAHSLGCILITHAAQEGLLPDTVAGALLVAPADVENGPDSDMSRVADFAPVPLSILPFPSLVVGSRNDPWLSVTQARLFARHWGAFFIDAGRKGHIGNQCDLGYWPDGLLLLDRLAQNSAYEYA